MEESGKLVRIRREAYEQELIARFFLWIFCLSQ